MHDIQRVQVLDSVYTLTEEFESFWLINDPMFVLIRKERTFFSELHNHINYVVVYESIPKLDDMRMIDRRMQIYLPLEQQHLPLRDIVKIDLLREYFTTLTA